MDKAGMRRGGAGFEGIVGESPAMRRLYEQMRRVAATDATVLILGESGTGKEAIAQALHAHGPRSGGPFVPVNCGAIPPTLIEAELLGHEKGSFTGAERRRAGYFERASGGTIFLDEVTEMPPAMQVKLLRVLESRAFQRVGGIETLHVDVRVIAASNRDVEAAVATGQLREDLLYRLAVFPLQVPPLRQREGDIVLLAQHFLDTLNARERTRKRYTRACLQELQRRHWAGNVRELKNWVSRAFILADDWLDVPPEPAAAAAPTHDAERGCLRVAIGTPLAVVQDELIRVTLQRMDGDKRRAAQALGVSLKTLYNRLDAARGNRID